MSAMPTKAYHPKCDTCGVLLDDAEYGEVTFGDPTAALEYATDSEIWPPPPAEPVPWRVRTRGAVKSWLRTRARGAGDRIAARFGYAHGDEAGW